MPRRALEITADICAALEFSHRHGIIHRDIKPGNVMLTQNGQVKVMDFGIARALASGATTMTQTSAVIGTAQYLSPEQARGEAVDARSDVYAAGCVLFELLCGHPPFVGDSPVSVAYQHVREDPQAAERHQPRRHRRRSTPSCSRRWRRTRSTATRAPARCAPTCCAPPPAGRSTPTPVHARARDRRDALARAGPRRARRRACRPGSATPAAGATSGWVIAALTALGVLAVVALVAGLIVSPASAKKATVPGAGRHDQGPGPGGADGAQPRARPADPVEAPTARPNQVVEQEQPASARVDVNSKVAYTSARPGKVIVPAV